MKRITWFVIFGLLTLWSDHAFSATYYTRSSGLWTGSIWGTSTTGPGSPFSSLLLQNGDRLVIDDNVALSEDLEIPRDIVILVAARITVNGQLRLGAGSIIQLTSGQIIPTPPGNSDKIFIGNGPAEWTGHDGTVTGPGYFNNGAWNPGLLPVKVTDFNVDEEDGRVSIQWVTSMEENFRHFIIQRSTDGVTFEAIGEVAGRGFDIHDITSKYAFVDENPLLGFNYYRLKAVDLDDSFEYFGVKAINVEAPRDFSVFPNPSAGDAIAFRTNFSPGEYDRVVLTDQVGIEVFSAPVALVQNQITFSEKLRPGVYLMRYIGRNYSQTTRVIVRN